MSDVGRAPRDVQELMRSFDQRLRTLERGGASRHGAWVVTADPTSGDLVASSPDRTITLTPPTPPDADVAAGIMPGVFAAYRSLTTGHTASAGYNPFAADWYDQVTLTSDRLIFDSTTNTVRCESTALLAVTVKQGIVAGQIGQRQYRTALGVAYDEADDPTIVDASPNGYYVSGVALIVGDTFYVPVTPGALLTPHGWASDGAIGAYTGDAAGLMTQFRIARVLDLR